MDLQQKLSILADAAKYDASCASSGARRPRPVDGLGNTTGMGICHSYTPDGRCVSLLKILLTNVCIFDCAYCVNRASSSVRRARFTPEEVVDLTLEFYRRNYIEGLFLSSGIVGSANVTMELLVRVARLLREEHRFGGYVHLKVVAGASPALVAEAGRWADRLSANIELPTQADLDRLAPAKSIALTEGTMGEIASRRLAAEDEGRPASFAPAGQTTQLVVGATPTSDHTILETASRLYTRHGLRRVYYTGYSPTLASAPSLPLERAPVAREHRLYEADWLLRFYGFSLAELVRPGGDLSLDIDPKLAWALAHPERFPIDVSTASREELLRVPGIGVRTVGRVLGARRYRRLSLDDLARLRVVVARARPYLVTADGLPRPPAPLQAEQQLGLFR